MVFSLLFSTWAMAVVVVPSTAPNMQAVRLMQERQREDDLVRSKCRVKATELALEVNCQKYTLVDLVKYYNLGGWPERGCASVSQNSTSEIIAAAAQVTAEYQKCLPELKARFPEENQKLRLEAEKRHQQELFWGLGIMITIFFVVMGLARLLPK